jgi:hypothetical protein
MQEKDVDIIAAERTVTIINIYTYKITWRVKIDIKF